MVKHWQKAHIVRAFVDRGGWETAPVIQRPRKVGAFQIHTPIRTGTTLVNFFPRQGQAKGVVQSLLPRVSRDRSPPTLITAQRSLGHGATVDRCCLLAVPARPHTNP